MPKLNPLPAKKMAKILYRLGFQELRVGGSHHFFMNPTTKKTALYRFVEMSIFQLAS